MLRGLLVTLVGANLLFLVWSQGWMAPVWPGPRVGQAEPQRLGNQVRPEWVQVLPASSAASLVATARRASRVCLEAGPLSVALLTAAEASLAAADVPAGSWVLRSDGRSDGAGGTWLRVDAADAALQAQLQALTGSELAGGFRPCRTP